MVEVSADVTPTLPDGADTWATRESVLADLRKIIDAIDRRIPHLERKGENCIVREAAALRLRAAERIAEIAATGPAAS